MNYKEFLKTAPIVAVYMDEDNEAAWARFQQDFGVFDCVVNLVSFSSENLEAWNKTISKSRREGKRILIWVEAPPGADLKNGPMLDVVFLISKRLQISAAVAFLPTVGVFYAQGKYRCYRSKLDSATAMEEVLNDVPPEQRKHFAFTHDDLKHAQDALIKPVATISLKQSRWHSFAWFLSGVFLTFAVLY